MCNNFLAIGFIRWWCFSFLLINLRSRYWYFGTNYTYKSKQINIKPDTIPH